MTIGKSTLFGSIASLVQIGTRMIMVPLVIAYLGVEGYGIWAVIMAITAYMRFGIAGVKSAFQKYVAEATGTGDFNHASRLVSTGGAMILAISIIALLPMAIFSHSFPEIMGVPKRFLDSTGSSISILALTMIISNVGCVYEAIIMGGHRIDIVRKFNILFLAGEFFAILVLLKSGHGLFAMAAVMAISEIGRLVCCYLFSERVLPQMHIGPSNFSWSLLSELLRFAGTYQLVNILEVISLGILPVAILKLFGANAAGIYAICERLVTAGLVFQEALLLPLLSGGSMIYGLRTHDSMRILLAKSLKTTLTLAIPPLSLLAVFGATIVLAWTGQSNELINVTLWFVCLAGLFRSIGRVNFIFYRTTGGIYDG
ncbi:MAG: lipopolysaccharide biosynthesis protein [Candidatus Hodarchaeota archaeon]